MAMHCTDDEVVLCLNNPINPGKTHEKNYIYMRSFGNAGTVSSRKVVFAHIGELYMITYLLVSV